MTFGTPAAQSTQKGVSVCMHLDREPTKVFGTINQYAASSNAFDRADEEMAIVLAAHAAVAIDSIGMNSEIDQLKLAVRSRDIIGQAKGILMSSAGLNADQAFDALRHASQMLNRRLAEIATDVAYLGRLPTDNPPKRLGESDSPHTNAS